jgi:hypothetical protein
MESQRHREVSRKLLVPATIEALHSTFPRTATGGVSSTPTLRLLNKTITDQRKIIDVVTTQSNANLSACISAEKNAANGKDLFEGMVGKQGKQIAKLDIDMDVNHN